MPSHHHHCCCCCCSRSSTCCSDSSPSATASTTSDQLLQLLSAHLLLQQPQIKPTHPLRPLKPPQKQQQQQHHPQHQQQPRYEDPTRALLNSLRRRIDALESSIPAPPPPPPPPPSLRDLAARTIQSAFRRHLLRRSQTLRHLNRLALLKSRAAALKSSLSASPDPKAISHTALDLLLDLDSIQSADPMIREGKRAISRELARMLEFVDKVLAREQQEQRESAPSRPARRVSFEESGDEPDSRGFEVGDGEVDYVGWKLDEGEESLKQFADPAFGSAMWEQFNGEVGKLGLSAPLPVKMETRGGDSEPRPNDSGEELVGQPGAVVGVAFIDMVMAQEQELEVAPNESRQMMRINFAPNGDESSPDDLVSEKKSRMGRD